MQTLLKVLLQNGMPCLKRKSPAAQRMLLISASSMVTLLNAGCSSTKGKGPPYPKSIEIDVEGSMSDYLIEIDHSNKGEALAIRLIPHDTEELREDLFNHHTFLDIKYNFGDSKESSFVLSPNTSFISHNYTLDLTDSRDDFQVDLIVNEKTDIEVFGEEFARNCQPDCPVARVIYIGGGAGDDAITLKETDEPEATSCDPIQVELLDTVFGATGNDILRGNDGSDRLLGGQGNDILYGENGSDNLIGGDGNDTIDGGGGRDYATFEYARADYEIEYHDDTNEYVLVRQDEQNTDIERDIIQNIEILHFNDIENTTGASLCRLQHVSECDKEISDYELCDDSVLSEESNEDVF